MTRVPLLAVSLLVLCWPSAPSAASGPVARWSFEPAAASGDVSPESLVGRVAYVPGVHGRALCFDGFTTRVVRPAEQSPVLHGGLTVEGWIAVRAYPWGWCPIVTQRDGEKAGYFFGLDAQGRLGLKLSVDGDWVACVSDTRLPLLAWAHVAGTFDPQSGLTLFLNGQKIAETKARGGLLPADDVDLLLGRNHRPEPAQFETASRAIEFSFDGLLDEVAIYNRVLGEAELSRRATPPSDLASPALVRPRLPSGAESRPPRFGAFYQRLAYHEAWDAQWRASGPDVVVTFDTAPFRLVCWRGISYAPCWVTEKGNWFTNEFMERGVDRATRGCTESMSDKRAEFSHVKILENSPARVVVYWRHAPVDIFYQTPYVDPETGWGDWAEEYHTIYPDGVAVRKVVMYSNALDQWHEWCQSIEPLHPGQRPEDVLDEARIVSLANMDGQGQDFGWLTGKKSYRYPSLERANIQITFLRSRYNPFLVLDASGGENDHGGQGPEITLVGGDGWSEFSRFPWRNHWPVTQVPIIGRYAVAADRAAHTYTSTQHSAAHARDEHSMTKIMLCGMTDREQATGLLPLARSWQDPPRLEVLAPGYSSQGYDRTERAYRVERSDGQDIAPLDLRVLATKRQPLVNLALVVRNWGDAAPRLERGGKVRASMTGYRHGYRRRIDGTDLILWLPIEATEAVRLTVRRE